MMELLEAALLALVQGLTEFLPISSSGHLIIIRDWIGLEEGDRGAAFDVVLHLGSLCAVVFAFRQLLWSILHDWWKALRSRPEAGSPQADNAHLGWCLLWATLPFVIAGLLLGEWAKGLLRSVSVTAWASIGFGVLLLAADVYGRKQRSLRELRLPPSILIGLTQILAMVPGASRSGTTMMGGLVVGLDRRSAASFSFLMSIPVILAVGGKTLWDQMEGGQGVHLDLGPLLVGFVVSAVSAWLCIRVFLRFVESVGMWPFVAYRVVLGVALLIWGTS